MTSKNGQIDKAKQDAGLSTAEAIGSIGRAFRRIGNFHEFIAGLEAGIGRLDFFDKAAISVFPELKPEEGEGRCFPSGGLSTPLRAGNETAGMIELRPQKEEIGPEDLLLMGGLAELISVLADHALVFGEQRRNLAYLDFLLNQAPVGAVCFDTEGTVLLANRLGKAWVGLKGEQRLPEAWRGRIGAAGELGGEFHCEVEGRLLHGQVRGVKTDTGRTGVTALVLSDMTGEIDRWRERFGREICRCGWLAQEFSLLELTASRASELMALLGTLREALPNNGLIGPIEINSIAIGFPERHFGEAMEMLRSVLPADRLEGISLGGASLGADTTDPDELFAAARQSRRPAVNGLRPRLLAHDNYGSVNDMLELILGEEFEVLKSDRVEKSVALAEQCGVDGVITELELGSDSCGVELVRNIRRWNPALREFYTSCTPDRFQQDPVLRDAVIFRKPFDVRDVSRRIRAAFK